MIKCDICGETSVVQVAENCGVKFSSCCNEKCEDYAELLIETNGGFKNVHEMLNAYKDVMKEITNEKDKVRRS